MHFPPNEAHAGYTRVERNNNTRNFIYVMGKLKVKIAFLHGLRNIPWTFVLSLIALWHFWTCMVFAIPIFSIDISC